MYIIHALVGDYYLGARLSTYGSLISIALTLLMPDYSVTPHKSDPSSTTIPPTPLAQTTIHKNKSVYNTIYKILNTVWLLLSIKILSGIATAMSTTVLPILLKSTYHFKEQHLGEYIIVVLLYVMYYTE